MRCRTTGLPRCRSPHDRTRFRVGTVLRFYWSPAPLSLSPGTLYGALAKLEADGFVQRLPADDRRYPYRLTPAGRTALAERLAESARIASLGLERIALGGP